MASFVGPGGFAIVLAIYGVAAFVPFAVFRAVNPNVGQGAQLAGYFGLTLVLTTPNGTDWEQVIHN